MALSKNTKRNSLQRRGSLRRKRNLKEVNPQSIQHYGTAGLYYIFEHTNVSIEFSSSEYIPMINYRVIKPVDRRLEDEYFSSDIIEILSAKKILLNNHVVITFPMSILRNGYYRCYRRESENERWQEIPREGKRKSNIYMKSIPGYVIVYTKHFTQFVCTCQRYPSRLGLDLVVKGNVRSGCSKSVAHEMEITVHTFDRRFSGENSERYIQKLKKDRCPLIEVYRNVLKGMSAVEVTDCISFSVDICSSSWRDIDENVGPFHAYADMHHLAECHTRGFVPGTEAAQFILQTEEKSIDEVSFSLKVYHSTKKENMNPENSDQTTELLNDGLSIYLSEQDTGPTRENGVWKTNEIQGTHKWPFTELKGEVHS